MSSLLELFLFVSDILKSQWAMLAKPDTLEDELLINFRDFPVKDA